MEDFLTPNLIPGIYNYCDSLCNRCAFTNRCAVTAFVRQMHLGVDNDEGPVSMGKPVQFVSVGLNLGDIGDDACPDLTDEEFQSLQEREARWDAVAKSHPLSELAFQYREQIHEMVHKKFHDFMDEKESELKGLEKMGLMTAASVMASLNELGNHFEMIAAFQFFFEMKINTALICRAEFMEDGKEHEGQKFHDGVMKVVLLTIGKSVDAWKQLQELFPEHEKEIVRNLVLLTRLKKLAEAEFPDAMKFRRPGFDEEELVSLLG